MISLTLMFIGRALPLLVQDGSRSEGARGREAGARMIHNSSGAGSDVLATDLNGDGIIDIVTATKRGLYIFWGQPKKQ